MFIIAKRCVICPQSLRERDKVVGFVNTAVFLQLADLRLKEERVLESGVGKVDIIRMIKVRCKSNDRNFKLVYKLHLVVNTPNLV